ncbi:hypothetical protein PR202_gb29060 [Eleusine coracana subsp. coracana]|uniref:Uncharacterized protein n=1 Tax=Eleusine coracana subsp. coracana TaxID=191504 RepID=A0AAV5FYX5_ELECO|nr:hypothetical protein PR202_gb29060 [Eleusine coracana subsp. coracana]
MVTEDDVKTMTYLKAVIKETIRLHPPAPLFIPHLSMEPCEVLEGYTIPAGTRVIVNAWAIGRLKEHWENPNEFLPERFSDAGDVELKWTTTKKDFRYVPFGSGRRMFPGIHAAAATLEIMLANLVYRFDWEMPPAGDEEGGHRYDGGVRIDCAHEGEALLGPEAGVREEAPCVLPLHSAERLGHGINGDLV